MTKVCNICKEEKHISEFCKQKNGKYGVTARCKCCLSEIAKESYKADPEKIRNNQRKYYEKYPKARRYAGMKWKYGITKDDYDKMVKDQNDSCAICNLPSSQLQRMLDIDHCHKTNKIRGLLCPNCNKAIGLLNDDPVIIENALKYLKHAYLE